MKDQLGGDLESGERGENKTLVKRLDQSLEKLMLVKVTQRIALNAWKVIR